MYRHLLPLFVEMTWKWRFVLSRSIYSLHYLYRLWFIWACSETMVFPDQHNSLSWGNPIVGFIAVTKASWDTAKHHCGVHIQFSPHIFKDAVQFPWWLAWVWLIWFLLVLKKWIEEKSAKTSFSLCYRGTHHKKFTHCTCTHCAVKFSHVSPGVTISMSGPASGSLDNSTW